MKKITVLSILVLILVLYLPAKTIKLPDLMNPGSILIDDNRAYINDGPTILIYSLSDFSLQKKFGREGEGPQEFKVNPNINKGGVYMTLAPDDLIISSIRRISFFSRAGEFKKIVNPGTYIGRCLSLKGGFVGNSVAQQGAAEYVTLNLYDADLKKEKEILRRFSWNAEKELDLIRFTSFLPVYVNDNKIFAGGDVYENVIKVFDHRGNKLSSISYDFEKIKLTPTHKKQILDYFEKSAGYKDFIKALQSKIKFAGYFPAIRHFQVVDKKIYVATYKVIKGLREFYIFDLNGVLLKKTMLPLLEDDLMHLKPYTIHQGKLYQLLEGEDGEYWELQITKIK